MKKLITVLCVFYSSFIWAGTEGDELKALLQPVTRMQANFQQKVMNEEGKILQSTTGSLWLEKPGKFRWEIKGDAPRWVISDGTRVWDYDADLSQVSVRKLFQKEEKLPISFLSGDVDTLEQDFKIKNCTRRDATCFELVPKESSDPNVKEEKPGIFQSIQLIFKDKVLIELQTVDQLGQRTVFRFSDVKTNAPISPTRFQFVPPKGVDVIGE